MRRCRKSRRCARLWIASFLVPQLLPVVACLWKTFSHLVRRRLHRQPKVRTSLCTWHVQLRLDHHAALLLSLLWQCASLCYTESRSGFTLDSFRYFFTLVVLTVCITDQDLNALPALTGTVISAQMARMPISRPQQSQQHSPLAALPVQVSSETVTAAALAATTAVTSSAAGATAGATSGATAGATSSTAITRFQNYDAPISPQVFLRPLSNGTGTPVALLQAPCSHAMADLCSVSCG